MKSGGKIARYTSMQRFARMPQRRTEPRRPALWMTSSGQAEEQKQDPVYVAKVRALPCIARSIFGHRCLGDVQAHHAGEHSAGKKAPDSTCVPLCMGGHRDLHELRGAFRDYTRVRIRELENRWIADTQRELGYAALCGSR